MTREKITLMAGWATVGIAVLAFIGTFIDGGALDIAGTIVIAIWAVDGYLLITK